MRVLALVRVFRSVYASVRGVCACSRACASVRGVQRCVFARRSMKDEEAAAALARAVASPARARDSARVGPEEPDCAMLVAEWLEKNPTEPIQSLLPGGAARKAAKRKAAEPKVASAATFGRPKRQRRKPEAGDPLPVPEDMPAEAKPQPGAARGRYNYTVYGSAGSPPASVNVQLRTKAFFVNRAAGGSVRTCARGCVAERALCRNSLRVSVSMRGRFFKP